MTWVNDNLANATAVSGYGGSITPLAYDATVDAATSESGESAYGTGQTLWWKWVAPAAGEFAFATVGSPSADADIHGLDTKVKVCSGPSSAPTHAALTEVGSNDDNSINVPYPYNSRATFTATAGATYYVQVDQYGSAQAGTLQLSWAPTTTWTATPDRGSATVWVGDTVTISGMHLDQATAVAVGDGSQPFTVVSSTQITFVVTSTARSGVLAVAFGSGSSNPVQSFSAAITVLHPGPWVQPADTTAVAAPTSGREYRNTVNMYGSVQPSFTGIPSTTTSTPLLDFDVEGSLARLEAGGPRWTWTARAAALILDTTGFMPPVAPAVFPPGAEDIEYEAEAGIEVGDPTVGFGAWLDTGDFVDDVAPKAANDLSVDLWQNTVEFRQLSGAAPSTWPTTTTLASLPLDHSEPVLEPGATSTPASTGSHTTNNYLTLNNPAPASPWTESVVPWTSWAGSAGAYTRGWMVALSTLIDGAAITAPQMLAGGENDLTTGNAKCHKFISGQPHVRATWLYRPPRYRLLYTSPPAGAGVLKVLAEGVWRNVGATASGTGRLKLWDGTQWLVECAAGTPGSHPLKVLVDGTWTVAASMIPA